MYNSVFLTQRLLGIKSTILLKPSGEIFQLGMNLPRLWNVRSVTNVVEPLEHGAQVLHHGHQALGNESESGRNRFPCLCIEDLGHLIECELISSQRHAFVLILIGAHERLRSEEANVTNRNQLKWLLLDHGFPAGSEDLSKEIRGEVVHKCDRAQNGPGHFRPLSLFNEMMLDLVLADKMRDGRRVVEGRVTAAINRGVDEVLDVVLESSIDKVLALSLFGFLI